MILTTLIMSGNKIAIAHETTIYVPVKIRFYFCEKSSFLKQELNIYFLKGKKFAGIDTINTKHTTTAAIKVG